MLKSILAFIINMFFSPTDRTSDDLDTIFSKLKDVKAFEKFHPLLIQQLCYYSYFESLEKGVTRKAVFDVFLFPITNT